MLTVIVGKMLLDIFLICPERSLIKLEKYWISILDALDLQQIQRQHHTRIVKQCDLVLFPSISLGLANY